MLIILVTYLTKERLRQWKEKNVEGFCQIIMLLPAQEFTRYLLLLAFNNFIVLKEVSFRCLEKLLELSSANSCKMPPV